jgi:hypothetical protein
VRLLVGLLAHEEPESVADQVAAFTRYLPGSPILIFNGGPDDHLFDGVPAAVCRYSTPLQWGRGLELVQLGLARQAHEDGVDYDYLLTVDSDMMLIKDGFDAYLGALLAEHDYMGAFLRQVSPPSRHVWTWRLTLQRRLWADIIGPPPFATVYNPGQLTRRVLFDRLFASPQQYQRLLGELQRTRLNCLEELLWPALAARLGLRLRGYPDAQAQALARIHDEGSLRAALADDEVYLVHKVPLDLATEERGLLVRARDGSVPDLPVRPAPAADAGEIPVLADSAIPPAARLGNLRLRAETATWAVRRRPPRLDDLDTLLRTRRYAPAADPVTGG